MATTIERPAPSAPEPPPPSSHVRRIVGGIALAAATPLLVIAAFPPVGWSLLIFVALVPALIAQHRVLPARLAGLGLAIGVGGAVLITTHIALGNRGSSTLKLLPVLFAVALVFLGRTERRWQTATRYRWFVIAVPLLWVGLDSLFNGSALLATWGYPAYALFGHPTLIQPVSVFGTQALNLLILLVNYAVAALFLRGVPSRRWVAVVAATAIAWLAVGLPLLGSTAGTTAMRVAAVEPGISSWHPAAVMPMNEFVDNYLRPYVDGTRQAAVRGARIVVWPEVALSFDPRKMGTAELQSLAAETNTFIVMGFVNGPGTNNATVLAPNGEFLGVYGKQHPVRFLGERSVPSPVRVYPTDVGRLATIICYDLDYLDTAREAGSRHAQVVAVPSHDWGEIASTHYTHLVFRAVENRLSFVKADAAWDSAVIDPHGRILARAVHPGGAPDLLVTEVPLGRGRAPAQVIGPWVPWIALVLAALVWLVPLRRLRRGTVATPVV